MSKEKSVQNLAAIAEVDTDSVQPFPNSHKIYVQGSRDDIQVPMREITLTPTLIAGSDPDQPAYEENPAVRVYDTSGSYTDPEREIDVRKGLPDVRREWIVERDDTLELPNESSIFTRERLSDPDTAH
ncbi:MAG: hypothetical protein HRU21_13150 [Pseudomonadales bacterium]|nr:hypothetical protein [Pseudomonadales bacterium]